MRRQVICYETPLCPSTPSSAPPAPPPFATAPLHALKRWMRTHALPVDCEMRAKMWCEVSARQLVDRGPDETAEEMELLETDKLPTFVEPRVARFFALNRRGRQEVNSVLWQLSTHCPQITWAPLLYPLAAIFLHFCSPRDTFRALYALVNARDTRFLAISRADRSRDAIVLLRLTRKLGLFARVPRVASEALRKLKNNALDVAFAEYLQWLLSLPTEHVVRLVDCFLVEGEKLLFRVAITLASMHAQHVKSGQFSLQEMRVFCETMDTRLAPQPLLEHAFKLTRRLSRREIQRQRAKCTRQHATELSLVGEESQPTARDVARDLQLGRRLAPRSFRCQSVEWAGLDVLWEWLPERVVVREPAVVFSTLDNGHSLQTLFSLAQDFPETLLIVKTVDGQVFGAFCSAPWALRHSDSAHFGTGETFLFALKPRPRRYEWVGKSGAQVAHAQQLFQSASGRELCVGSGGGRFGLFIDESLTRGRSERCDTFDNEPLSGGIDFEIASIEVIAFC